MQTSKMTHMELSQANDAARHAISTLDSNTQKMRHRSDAIGDLNDIVQKLKNLRNAYAKLNRVNSLV